MHLSPILPSLSFSRFPGAGDSGMMRVNNFTTNNERSQLREWYCAITFQLNIIQIVYKLIQIDLYFFLLYFQTASSTLSRKVFDNYQQTSDE